MESNKSLKSKVNNLEILIKNLENKIKNLQSKNENLEKILDENKKFITEKDYDFLDLQSKLLVEKVKRLNLIMKLKVFEDKNEFESKLKKKKCSASLIHFINEPIEIRASNDLYIEIYNKTNQRILLQDWVLMCKNEKDSFVHKFNEFNIIKPYTSFFIWSKDSQRIKDTNDIIAGINLPFGYRKTTTLLDSNNNKISELY